MDRLSPRYLGPLGLALLAGLALRLPDVAASNQAHLAILACGWPGPVVTLACGVDPEVRLNRAWRQVEASPRLAERARFFSYAQDWPAILADNERVGPARPDPLRQYFVGLAHYRLGQVGEAVAAWQQTPNTAVYWTHRCEQEIGRQQWDAALEACELALQIDPRHGRAYAELGRVRLYGFRDPRAALDAFATAEALGGLDAAAWLAWAHALDHVGRSTEAAALVEAHASEGALADTIRGNGLRQGGRLDEALVMYQRALAQNDRDPWIWHALAVTHRQLGDPAAARTAWAEALALSPDFQPALDGLAALGPG